MSISKFLKRSTSCLLLAATIIAGSGDMVKAGINVDSSNKYYYKKTSDTSTYYGYGTLYSYLERRKSPSWSGNTGSVDYYVYAKCDTSVKVNKIMTTWTCSGTFLSSSASSFGVTVGTTSAATSMSSSGSYTTVDVKSYTYNTNGTALAWYSSNYILQPANLYISTSMINEAYVELKGEPICQRISASA